MGTQLLDDVAHRTSGKLFTSTNRSNGPMRQLLTGHGWHRCGELSGLAEGDPEMFFRWDEIS